MLDRILNFLTDFETYKPLYTFLLGIMIKTTLDTMIELF